MRSFLLLCLAFIKQVWTIPVDNGVEGEPEIECGPTSITINFNTRNQFEGHVYVKGLYDQAGCRSDEGGRQVAGIELPFDTCNVARTRSLNPRGIFVTTTVVISFHPQFVTKVDRAYRLQCFYMEADKTVSTNLEVSDMTTAFQTAVVPMPVCRYEILNGGPTGEPIHFATIGQQVYHKWTCDSETTDTFCAVVHSCTVDDGNGDTVQILNEDGCALDKYLLNNLEYPTDLMAGQEAHVYKYADRAELFYQCQISITIKEPNADCPRPNCPEPTGFNAPKTGSGPAAGGAAAATAGGGGGGAAPQPLARSASAGRTNTQRLLRRSTLHSIDRPSAEVAGAAADLYKGKKRRFTRSQHFDPANTMDVRVEMSTMDISDKESSRDVARLLHMEPIQATRAVCLTTLGVSMLSAAIILLIVSSVALGSCVFGRRKKWY